MAYPCFLYRPSRPATHRADNRVYMYVPCYNVVFISQEPNEEIERWMLGHFDHCDVDREYESDGLYHYSYTLFW